VVEDYVAAGKRYLEIVGPSNAYLDELNGAIERRQFSELRSTTARASDMSSREAKDFQRYPSWPKAVEKDIDVLARGLLLEADYYNSVAKAGSLGDADAVGLPTYPKGYDNAPVLIRAALGLPKRG
jgi:hypothetical protein